MIRPMVTADADAVAALIRAAFAAIPTRLDPSPSALRVTEAEVAAVLEAGGGAVWDEAGVQGCVLWEARPQGLYMGRLAVRPGWQGRGVARRLLAAAEAEARRRGLPKLMLAVRLALDGNRRLFRAAGFTETTLRTHDGYAEPTFVEAEKRL